MGANRVRYISQIVFKQKNGIPAGCYSACTANEWVIEAVLEKAKEHNTYAVIEATANQVNQFGGYTGMKPIDFKNMVFAIAEKTGMDKNKIILGGDHLGPLVWKDETNVIAMKYAEELISEYVMSGYTKIHIDTSMRLSEDISDTVLSDEIIAERSAFLLKSAKKAFDLYKEKNPEAEEPVFIIGSEVPVPGGTEESEETVNVTGAEDFVRTVTTFKEVYARHALSFDDIVAVVVQPGVEFADDSVIEYCPEKTAALSNALRKYSNLVFEGHSTDYQKREDLKAMVRDGVGILKVGPALTFSFREALFALELIEKELYRTKPFVKLSNIKSVIENSMIENPKNWCKYYHGNRAEIMCSINYSYSDRSRYYMSDEIIASSISTLIENINSVDVPMTLISQYMPKQYDHLRKNKKDLTAEWLIKDKIKDRIDDYLYAVGVI